MIACTQRRIAESRSAPEDQHSNQSARDIFLNDLRAKNKENNHQLPPIK
jgi:hypothetical protein